MDGNEYVDYRLGYGPVILGHAFPSVHEAVHKAALRGQVYALDNACAHRGGPLGEGDLEGSVVMCPWHAWRWDVTTGANVNNPAVKVACFPVTVTGGEVFVEVTPFSGGR